MSKFILPPLHLQKSFPHPYSTYTPAWLMVRLFTFTPLNIKIIAFKYFRVRVQQRDMINYYKRLID